MQPLHCLRFTAALLICGGLTVGAALAQTTTTTTAAQPAAKPPAGLAPKAAQCVTELNPQSRMIFDAVYPKMATAKDIRDLVKETTKGFVKSGKLKRDEAKDSAMAAGKCIRMASNK